MEKQYKIIAVLFVAVLFASTVATGQALTNMSALQEQLDEQMSLNKDSPDFGASVYWYKNGQFIYAEHNLVCNVGLNNTAHHIGDQSWVNNNATTNAFQWIAIGTGTGQGAGDQTLASESFRAAGTFAVVASVNGNWTITYTWTAGTFSGETITEAGVFNAAAVGVMLNYQSFSGITLQSGDSLQVQFMYQVS
jgi:hypothetical protein